MRRPVLRAAMRPTLRPAEVSRRTVDAIPGVGRGKRGMNVTNCERSKPSNDNDRHYRGCKKRMEERAEDVMNDEGSGKKIWADENSGI